MSGHGPLRRGGYMLRGGSTWRVNLLKDGVIHLERDDTGEVDRLPVKQWQLECSEGATRMVGSPDAELTPGERALRKVALRDLPGNVRASALKKEFYVHAFEEPSAFYRTHMPELPERDRIRPEKTKRLLAPFAQFVSAAFGRQHGTELVQLFERAGATARRRSPRERDRIPVPAHFLRPPAFSTYCSWLARWEDVIARNGTADARLLASRFHDRGPRVRTMPPLVEEWLNDAIDEVWLTPSCNKKVKVHRTLARRVSRHNTAHPEDAMPLPSQRHVSRYIAETVDQEDATRRRKGDKFADEVFRPVGEGPQARSVFDVVEVDHTRANVDVLDDLTGVKLGRPWVTTALDRYSRLPVGLHVHFDGPSLGAVMQALRNVMVPKSYLGELLPDLDYEYPGCGVPETFFFDRGSDFDNDHVREVMLEFDVAIEYEPAGCPQYKGKLERWHRTMAEQVTHPLPGATPPRDRDGFRRDPDGKAYITFGEYVRRLWRWIAMVYARAPHRGLGTTPLLKFEEGAALRLPRPLPPKETLSMLLNRVELLVPSNRGVQWKHLRWNGEALRRIRAAPSFRKGERVKVRIDESDVGRAWVTDPVTRGQEQLEPVLKDYMPGLTLYQHRMAVLYADEHMEGARDEQSFRDAQEALDVEAEELLSRNRNARKGIAAAARHLGIGSGNPDAGPGGPPRGRTRKGQVAAARNQEPPLADIALDAVPGGDDDVLPMREVRKNTRPTTAGAG